MAIREPTEARSIAEVEERDAFKEHLRFLRSAAINQEDDNRLRQLDAFEMFSVNGRTVDEISARLHMKREDVVKAFHETKNAIRALDRSDELAPVIAEAGETKPQS